MKTLVLYATRTGLTYNIAQKIAGELDAEIAQISDGKDYSGFFGYIRAAIEGLKKSPRPNVPLETKEKLDAYERIVLTGPIWAENWCSINRSFLKEHGKEISCPVYFVFTHMSKITYDKCASDADKYLNAPHKGFLTVSTHIKTDADQQALDSALCTFIKTLSPES